MPVDKSKFLQSISRTRVCVCVCVCICVCVCVCYTCCALILPLTSPQVGCEPALLACCFVGMQVQHKSDIGLVTTTCGVSCRHSRQRGSLVCVNSHKLLKYLSASKNNVIYSTNHSMPSKRCIVINYSCSYSSIIIQ